MLMQMSMGFAFDPMRIVISASTAMTLTSSRILYTPSWSQHRQSRIGNLQHVLHHKSSSEVSPFCAACRPGIVIYPLSSEVSSSVPPDRMAFVRGRTSFICRGMPSTITVCRLITCYRSFLELGRESITRRFDPHGVAQTIPVLCGGWWRGHWVNIPYPNLISVNPVGRGSQRWCIILGRNIPVHRFLNRAPHPSLILRWHCSTMPLPAGTWHTKNAGALPIWRKTPH